VQCTKEVTKHVTFVARWILLGVASSIGFGTGLHTFITHLGPFIADVAFTATDCRTLAFDTSVVPLRCPDAGVPVVPVTLLGILAKVWIPAFLWGLGTAIGELPPYFIARQTARSGEKLKEIEELKEVRVVCGGGSYWRMRACRCRSLMCASLSVAMDLIDGRGRAPFSRSIVR
jgi:hypothetical protein